MPTRTQPQATTPASISSASASARPGNTGFGEQDLAQFRARQAQLHPSGSEIEIEILPPTDVAAYVAYTDGACFGNPNGPGGWGAYIHPADNPAIEWNLWGHLSSTSNNRAEALAILAAVEWIPPHSSLALWSDSELSVKILTGDYKARKNPDIWAEIRHSLAERQIRLEPKWLRGHVGHAGNERADALSRLGAHNFLGAFDPSSSAAPAANLSPARTVRDSAVPPELQGLKAASPWESQFLSSVARQLRTGRALSEKQTAIVDRIRRRQAPPA